MAITGHRLPHLTPNTRLHDALLAAGGGDAKNGKEKARSTALGMLLLSPQPQPHRFI
jgi:hypothetical protein